MFHQETNKAISLPIRRTDLSRQTPFSFSCMRCLKCCSSKKIQVNPYEIARLAKNLEISTTEFIARYTTDNGSFIRFDENNSCIFLAAEGCRVHPDRPLVCRLYPLGRHLNENGEEWFSEIEPEPGCDGKYGGDASLETYLKEQDVYHYMQAVDRYLKLLWEMMTILENTAGDKTIEKDQESADGEENSMFENGDWMDMDAVISNYCIKAQIPFPNDVDKKMRIHQNALKFLIKKS